MTIAAENRRIADVVQRERRRLLAFIRRWVPDEYEAEDILQDVFYELTEALRLMKPVEHVGAWLFRVARNRVIDRFRKKRPEPADLSALEDLLPSGDAGPEAAYARGVLLEEVNAALDELPEEQREAFVQTAIEGRSFKELAEKTGVNVNTWLSRKHYAVLHLRRRLQQVYDEFRNR